MNAKIEYEVVKAAPVEAIADLYKAGGWWQESQRSRSIIEPMIRGSFCFMIARAPSGQIVGMARAISDGASDAYIQDVVVLVPYRGQGIGRRLILNVVEYCIERKIGWIGLVAEPGTHAFYESIGFSRLEDYRPMLYSIRG
jgi:ribosomal protein S18 acetylase RimI-like enzyme